MKTINQFSIVAVLLLSAQVIISCHLSQKENADSCDLGDYESMTINIDPQNATEPLESNQYTIDSIRSLIIPDSLGFFYAAKFYVDNEKIYVMDTDNAKTILVFDILGNYLYKLGERGRAKNEYIDAPRDFFVAKNGDVHAFDVWSQNVLIFDKNGKFIKTIETPDAHSFGLTSNDKYVYFLDHRDFADPSLSIYDPKSNTKKDLIPSRHFQCFYQPSFRTFFYNDTRLSHIPLLSDSVIVFKDDTVEKVVHFDFKCGFLTNDKPECVKVIDGIFPKDFGKCSKEYQGVFAIFDYQETESLALMNYQYKSRYKTWLYDKRTKKTIHGDKIFPGFRASYNYYLKGNQIIAFVGKGNVDTLNEYCESEEFDEKDFKKSYSQVKDLRKGKIPVPALFYITIK